MGRYKVGTLIAAGGLSQRMKDFKPLMKISGVSMIENTVMNYESCGISDIIAVTGYRSNDIGYALRKHNIKFIINNNYLNTQMFDSVCLGLKEFSNKCDAVFITPADCPFVRASTLKSMMENMKKKRLYYIKPLYKGKGGHPLFVSNECIKIILKHDGSMGLRGAVSKIDENYENINFDDPGILLDADDKNDFQKIINYKENSLF